MKFEEVKEIEKKSKEEGISAAEFCRKNGINVNHYYLGKSKFNRKNEIIKVLKPMPTRENTISFKANGIEFELAFANHNQLALILKAVKNV